MARTATLHGKRVCPKLSNGQKEERCTRQMKLASDIAGAQRAYAQEARDIAQNHGRSLKWTCVQLLKSQNLRDRRRINSWNAFIRAKLCDANSGRDRGDRVKLTQFVAQNKDDLLVAYKNLTPAQQEAYNAEVQVARDTKVMVVHSNPKAISHTVSATFANMDQEMKEYCRLKVPEDAITHSSSQFDLLDALAQQFNICDMALGGPRPTEQQSMREEYQLYINDGYVPETMDPLKFWEVNRMQFPTLFAIAMDYLPIQASSIPCERVFSSSAEMDTKKRNQIGPILMEALQMLKYHLKQEQLDFMVNWTISPESLVEDEPEEPAKGTRRHDIQLSSLDTLLDRSVAEDGDDLSTDVEIFV
ncbi:hypothetical protein PISMIDRAFT_18700 [Pisolithus microcarpus 441]|uniref:HAT C-terminal dimerisation domain-containing protein n=1 Tax=Pisolithus microcarpus 441 TaxID=765257 RepID=A0A0C9XJR4_9AGAM|nr:hypothetical protein PISMIDRAFT_18700 [Pisolithus microcarpus 441]